MRNSGRKPWRSTVWPLMLHRPEMKTNTCITATEQLATTSWCGASSFYGWGRLIDIGRWFDAHFAAGCSSIRFCGAPYTCGSMCASILLTEFGSGNTTSPHFKRFQHYNGKPLTVYLLNSHKFPAGNGYSKVIRLALSSAAATC